MRESGCNHALDQLSLSPFDAIVGQLAAVECTRPVIPLHQGKTAFTTPIDLREWEPGEFEYPAHHDGPPAGVPALLAAVTEKIERRLEQDVEPSRVQITAGITHALTIAFHSVLRPGDEVILLSPQWLFASGLVRAAQGVPVELPWFSAPDSPGPVKLLSRIENAITPRTRAIYLNTPNNPTGRSMPARQLSALLDLAADRGLWVIADNAYEYYDYSDGGFVDPAGLPLGGDHVFAAYSFSKTYGMTGYRIGYLLSPPRMAEVVRKFSLYSIYSVPTCSQFVALGALRGQPSFLARNQEFVKTALDLTVDKLTVPATRPDGGFYCFLDLSGWEYGAQDFIARCIREGVSLAPGAAFGHHYQDYARLCYSVVGHDDLISGIDIINSVFASSPSEPVLVART